MLLFQKAFKKIDVDGNQKLSLNEAKHLIKTYESQFMFNPYFPVQRYDGHSVLNTALDSLSRMPVHLDDGELKHREEVGGGPHGLPR